MADIYSNSYLNVSVTSAENPTMGFLGDRQRLDHDRPRDTMGPAIVYPFPWFGVLGVEHTSAAVIDIAVKEFLSHEVLNIGVDKQSSSFLTLFGRAWAFQERLLSPKAVHFTRQEMMWECSSSVACECKQLEPPIQQHDNQTLQWGEAVQNCSTSEVFSLPSQDLAV
jgi:hypothetical protein